MGRSIRSRIEAIEKSLAGKEPESNRVATSRPRKRSSKKPSGPSAMVIVGRCLSIRVAVRMLYVARKRLKVNDEKSDWVFAGAEAMDRELAGMQASLVEQMRALWPTAAEEVEAWLKSNPDLPESLKPPYTHPDLT